MHVRTRSMCRYTGRGYTGHGVVFILIVIAIDFTYILDE